jgi:uncharacterized protein (UPF0305 family)
MDRGLLIKQLQAAPVAIRTAEEARDAKFMQLLEARRTLESERQAFIVDGTLDGKNETVRAAQLDQMTAPEKIVVDNLDLQLRALAREVQFQERTFQALLKIADIFVDEIVVVKKEPKKPI